MDELGVRRAMRELESLGVKKRGAPTVSFCTLDGAHFTVPYDPDREITAESIERLRALAEKHRGGG